MEPEDLSQYFLYRKKPSEEKLLLQSVHDNSDWLPFVQRMSDSGLITAALQNAFHITWVESGHIIRNQINDDEAVAFLLSKLMPPYSGEGMTVFRGENEIRFKSGLIGFCWTANREIAERFARGLNACKGNGLLLEAYAPSNAIFSVPNEHSRYLEEDEVTVNPRKLINLQIISSYPKSH
ncbi:hypothetical protein [Pantoea sp. ACRSB]|uniref:hypothetical protein n=1 Tax=Pantoea sp. ACRSB TaxID=2918207 RepID=UPI0028936088|nr:hypothetical protein [Pantoea sp. ACRSB]MCG7388312.1 hypothetical protein [Pantoea sp. ACRSB]